MKKGIVMGKQKVVLFIIFILFMTTSLSAEVLNQEIVIERQAETEDDIILERNVIVNAQDIPIKRIFIEEMGMPFGNETVWGKEFETQPEDMYVADIKEEVVLEDGLYEVRNALLDVLVSVLDGKITDIKILKYRGGGDNYKDMVKPVILSIIEKQSLEVDAVTGATMSTDSLKEAVGQAIERATKGK